MRVVLVPSAYLPALGGVEELTRHLALTLSNAGDEVEIWTGRPEAFGGVIVEQMDGLMVRRFPFPLPALVPRSLANFALAVSPAMGMLARAVRAFRPDVVHVQCFGPNGVYATALSLLMRVPLLLTLQGETLMDDHDVYAHSQVMRSSLRLGLRRAAVVTGCSAFTLKDAEQRFGLPIGKGRVVFNGVLTEVDTPDTTAPLARRLTEGRPFLLAVGRVVHKKGFDLLIRAFSNTKLDSHDTDLIIAGDGSARQALIRLSEELGIPSRVHLPGRLTREDVAVAMAEATLFVMPSRLEPFGIVILEAWRAERAVIASRVGGPPEFVRDGIDGILVDPTDIGRLAHVVDELIRDTHQREALGRAGHDRVRDFSWTAIADRYRRLYEEACS